ncbi:hypothetical protein BD309DRAFT_974463 [Dichomitus squalens]|uniref:Uncharacterized protein n=1 Tax=Dichomitus squalens TaxID=114155 RepID=A0A4Q9N914_9APHY|nr:hypothetical protein BD309DRAFT_974463 [Dichomitus squalens]TBU59225.1 hypothetical protein BD310DRAFT_817735 [Dichomitus squalens]
MMSVPAVSTSGESATIPGGYNGDTPSPSAEDENIPLNLRRAAHRMQFPPSYVVVGFYRLLTDPHLRVPAWKKCEHAFMRGATVGLVWATGTYKIQKLFVEYFLINSPRVTGLSRDALFGIPLPFDVPTYATLFFLSSQVSAVIYFFLSRNIRIARERAYEQTIQSRGKGADWWQPYVEEWDNPPRVEPSKWKLSFFMGGPVGRMVAKVLPIPLNFIPFAGMFIAAAFRALGTARYLHEPYYKAKGMTKEQIAVFIEERKWEYRVFGFTAALVERIPIIGLIFSVSNRIGAAMWAHDLEKRQHYVAATKAGLAAGSPYLSSRPKTE